MRAILPAVLSTSDVPEGAAELALAMMIDAGFIAADPTQRVTEDIIVPVYESVSAALRGHTPDGPEDQVITQAVESAGFSKTDHHFLHLCNAIYIIRQIRENEEHNTTIPTRQQTLASRLVAFHDAINNTFGLVSYAKTDYLPRASLVARIRSENRMALEDSAQLLAGLLSDRKPVRFSRETTAIAGGAGNLERGSGSLTTVFSPLVIRTVRNEDAAAGTVHKFSSLASIVRYAAFSESKFLFFLAGLSLTFASIVIFVVVNLTSSVTGPAQAALDDVLASSAGNYDRADVIRILESVERNETQRAAKWTAELTWLDGFIGRLATAAFAAQLAAILSDRTTIGRLWSAWRRKQTGVIVEWRSNSSMVRV